MSVGRAQPLSGENVVFVQSRDAASSPRGLSKLNRRSMTGTVRKQFFMSAERVVFLDDLHGRVSPFTESS